MPNTKRWKLVEVHTVGPVRWDCRLDERDTETFLKWFNEATLGTFTLLVSDAILVLDRRHVVCVLLKDE